VHLRARKWGYSEGSVVWDGNRLKLNEAAGVNDQWKYHVRYAEDQDNKVNPDSWVAVNCYAWYNASTSPNIAYPGGKDGCIFNNALGGDASGFHQISGVTEREDGGLSGRYNTLLAHALFYASEFLGSRHVLKRKFPTCWDDSGSINGVRPGLRCSFFYRGALRDFRVIKTKQNLRYNWTEAELIEDVDYSALLNYEFFSGGEGTGSSAGANTSTSSLISIIDRSQSSADIVVHTVCDTVAELSDTIWTEPTLALVVGETLDVDNGLYRVGALGATVTRDARKLRYGTTVFAYSSGVNAAGTLGIYGSHSLWKLTEQVRYDPNSFPVIGANLTPDVDDQRWIRYDALRGVSVLNVSGPDEYNEADYTKGIIQYTSADASVNFGLSQGTANGERAVIVDASVNFPSPPCSVGRFRATGLTIPSAGGGAWISVDATIDDYCGGTFGAAPFGSDATSATPIRIRPQTAGYYLFSPIRIYGTLPVGFGASDIRMRLQHVDPGAPLTTNYMIDRRYHALANSADFFLTGSEQPIRFDGVDDYVELQMSHMAVGLQVLTGVTVEIAYHWAGDCPSCVPL
jgi:hypothetical protein